MASIENEVSGKGTFQDIDRGAIQDSEDAAQMYRHYMALGSLSRVRWTNVQHPPVESPRDEAEIRNEMSNRTTGPQHNLQLRSQVIKFQCSYTH